ncbi:hypothetical protein F53441_4565 [Fusarium austroafricanum]|uniref:Clr5 domain-containing protein n=1 Tax=Fusarium austroafricanum TaxID=2364996 RepID=A0A8H4P1L5_9HYPO|nr:hypothetical protein F53441_4565 [Fusarium austroafricanum]
MMAKPWNEHRGIITKLYIKEGRTLKDVRNIMKMQHNFDASIRSYRQHFDKWGIGKYTCKKRDERRRQTLIKSLSLSPPHSPSDVVVKKEEEGSPATSTSSMSRRSSVQKPLPVLKQPNLYPGYFQDQVRPQDDPQVKIENSRAPLWEGLDLDMFRGTHVAQGMLPSLIPTLETGKPIEEHRRHTLAVLHSLFVGLIMRI